MSTTERLEQATMQLLTEQFYVVETAQPGLTDEQVRELLEWHSESHTV